MQLSLTTLAESPLKDLQVSDDLRVTDPRLVNILTDEGSEINHICEATSQRVETILTKDKKKKIKDKKLPELGRTPYSVLITKLCRKDFDVAELSQSEIALLGFLPISIHRTKVRELIGRVAGKIVTTFTKDSELDDEEKLSKAKETVFKSLVINFEKGLAKSFNELPIDLNVLKEGLVLTPKRLGEIVKKLNEEGKTSDTDVLREMGLTEEEIPEILKEVQLAGKAAIKFYREMNKHVSEAQKKFVQKEGDGLMGFQAWNDPYVENSQATLFTLLNNVYSKNINGNGDTLSMRNEAQILLQIRVLYLQITNDPIFQAMEESTELLDKFAKSFYGDSTKEHVVVEINESGDISERPQVMQRNLTLRRFDDSGIRVYAEDKIREKEWESIMLKIITGECPIDRIPDMLAGQFALFDMTKEDLYYEEGCEDFERIERVEKNLKFAKGLLVKAANDMGCTEEVSDTTDYHDLKIGQFKIENKILGSKKEKSHNFSALKCYICVAGKNGAPLRVEYRGVPWNTYLASKSIESLNGDKNYALKKFLVFAKSAVRKSQNERFIEVVEILLEFFDLMEEGDLAKAAA